jgi:UDP-glucose:(heptosyl)LPS alpha-1,3-glucosyltransferase
VRVALVIDRYRPGKGGLEAWLGALLDHLSGRDHDAHVVSQDRAIPAGPFTHHSLEPSGVTRARRDRDFAERARDLCDEEAFDAVLGLRHCLSCHVYAPHGGSVAASIEAHREAKLLPSLPSAKVSTLLSLERELLEGPEPPRLVIAVSNMVAEDLGARFPGIRERIRVVPNGVDLDRFTPEGREAARSRLAPDGGGVALFLAGNPRLKGIGHARETYRRLSEAGAASTLLVGGGDPGRLPEGGRYLGNLDRPEDALRAADVLLHPTHHDPFPLVVLEALACGTPVVTTERNGVLDHVGRDGPVRAVADPKDVAGMARHASSLLREAPREEARRRAEAFPLAESLAATEAVLRESAEPRC